MGRRGIRRESKVVWPGFSYVARPRHVSKVGRNDQCPCGSGRKYKDCHEPQGEKFLLSLARREEKERRREERQRLREAGVPWYRRLFRP